MYDGEPHSCIMDFIRQERRINFHLSVIMYHRLHIHLQNGSRLPLPLSTGGLGLNYIWAEAAIQSEITVQRETGAAH